MQADYYDILGVAEDATQEEIKDAYRRKAMQHHPDRAEEDGAEEQFKKINEAYQVLSDPEARRKYDRGGLGDLEGEAFGHGAGGAGRMNFEEAIRQFMHEFDAAGQGGRGRQGGLGGLGDLFFGQGQQGRSRQQQRQQRAQRQQASKGEDIETVLKLDLQEVAHGTTRKIDVQAYRTCQSCQGHGTRSGQQASTCNTCQGEGRVAREQRTMLGRRRTIHRCPDCQGQGRSVQDPCQDCGGQGRVLEAEEFELEIPPGVNENDYLRLRGQGHAGPQNGSAGDLYVGVQIDTGEKFTRQGQTLILERQISYTTAALGGTIEVETVDGTAQVEVPAGVQDGQAVRLSGKGLPAAGGGKRGDQLVRLHIWVPTDLSKQEHQALENLRDVESTPPDHNT